MKKIDNIDIFELKIPKSLFKKTLVRRVKFIYEIKGIDEIVIYMEKGPEQEVIGSLNLNEPDIDLTLSQKVFIQTRLKDISMVCLKKLKELDYLEPKLLNILKLSRLYLNFTSHNTIGVSFDVVNSVFLFSKYHIHSTYSDEITETVILSHPHEKEIWYIGLIYIYNEG